MRSVALTRHVLPFALALLAAALLAPSPARGVTLGNVASQSSLGQPLRVEIPIVLSGGETLNAACLKLVADNTVSAPPQIVTGRVSVERATTSPRLVIATATPLNEPAVRLAVQAGCGSTMRRDYVLLLDPPSEASPTMVASADAEEPAWTTRPQPAAAAPRTTWGRPLFAAAQPAREVRPPMPTQEARAPTQIAERPAALQREMVTLAGGTGSAGFIPEAAAAALPVRPLPSPSASAKSLPLISVPGSRPQTQVPATAVWQQAWPYVAIVFGAIVLTLVLFVLHRRFALQTWIAPSARGPLTSETQAGIPQVTFAHFGAMTEPVQRAPKVPMATAPKKGKDQTVAITELDTLLHDIQNDLIDDRTIKEAWKAAAADAAADMGGDSILKAIAAAERDLQIGAPEPVQTAMDTALDNELLTIPNLPTKPKRG